VLNLRARARERVCVSVSVQVCVFGPAGRSDEGLQGEAPRDEAARARRRPRRLRHAGCKRYVQKVHFYVMSGRGEARRGAEAEGGRERERGGEVVDRLERIGIVVIFRPGS